MTEEIYVASLFASRPQAGDKEDFQKWAYDELLAWLRAHEPKDIAVTELPHPRFLMRFFEITPEGDEAPQNDVTVTEDEAEEVMSEPSE